MHGGREMPEKRPLSIEQREALLALRSRGPGARLDQDALYGLASAGLIEVNSERRVVLTARGLPPAKRPSVNKAFIAFPVLTAMIRPSGEAFCRPSANAEQFLKSVG